MNNFFFSIFASNLLIMTKRINRIKMEILVIIFIEKSIFAEYSMEEKDFLKDFVMTRIKRPFFRSQLCIEIRFSFSEIIPFFKNWARYLYLWSNSRLSQQILHESENLNHKRCCFILFQWWIFTPFEIGMKV